MCAISGKNGKLTGFRRLTESPVTFTLTEFDMDVPALPEGANVYEEKDVAIVMELTSASGRTLRVDGFYYEEYEFDDEMVTVGPADTAPRFRVRVSLPEVGNWNYVVTLTIGGETVDTLEGSLTAADKGRPSRILQVEPTARRTFQTVGGEITPLVGEDLGWMPYHFNEWGQYMVRKFHHRAAHGVNVARIWDYIDSGGINRKTMTTMHQSSSARWDLAFQAAEEDNIYISFVLINHGEISATIDSRWDASVWHVNQGGTCVNAEEFYTDRRAVDAFKSYCRYIVSRWGYSEHVIWELCNEIDHSSGLCLGMTDEVRAWIREITACLKERDPYGHMVTNSAGYPSVAMSVQEPCLDFMYFHVYNPISVTMLRDLMSNARRAFDCPVLVGEFGYDGPSTKSFGGAVTDEGSALHLGNWAGLFGGSAGTALGWFWYAMKDEYYNEYDAVAKMAKRLPLDDPSLRDVDHMEIALANRQLGVMGYQNETSAYLWIYDELYQPIRKVETPFNAESLTLSLADGTYTATWYDTRTDEIVATQTVQAQAGTLTLFTPAFSKDIAVIVKQEELL